MIIDSQDAVTPAVLEAMAQTPDPRLREVMTALVRHLHAFAREVKPTEEEFEKGIDFLIQLGKLTTDTHNEAILASDSLGVSTLVCLLNNGNNGSTETAAALLGPFWRMNSPRTEDGGSIVRSPTPGDPLFMTGRVTDPQGRPVEGAEVDVWHASPVGMYENQDENQADMNLRGKFTTDADGRFSFPTVKPAGYPIPTHGVVGKLIQAQRRHPYRPAHLHALIFKPGFKVLISQVYDPNDPHIDTDVQFGVTKALIGDFQRHEEAHPSEPDVI